MLILSSLDKDHMKAVIDEVTRWLHLAEEGDWMALPGIAGRQGRRSGHSRTLFSAGQAFARGPGGERELCPPATLKAA